VHDREDRLDFSEGFKKEGYGIKFADTVAEAVLAAREGVTKFVCDIRLKNVIVNEKNKILAIIDWENCTSNIAPYWELSLALHDLSMDEKQSFLEGYGLNVEDYMRVAPGIKALNVLLYSRSVHHALKRNDKTRLLGLRARLSGAFDLYSL